MTYRQLATWSHAVFLAGLLLGRHTDLPWYLFAAMGAGYGFAAVVEWWRDRA